MSVVKRRRCPPLKRLNTLPRRSAFNLHAEQYLIHSSDNPPSIGNSDHDHRPRSIVSCPFRDVRRCPGGIRDRGHAHCGSGRHTCHGISHPPHEEIELPGKSSPFVGRFGLSTSEKRQPCNSIFRRKLLRAISIGGQRANSRHVHAETTGRDFRRYRPHSVSAACVAGGWTAFPSPVLQRTKKCMHPLGPHPDMLGWTATYNGRADANMLASVRHF